MKVGGWEGFLVKEYKSQNPGGNMLKHIGQENEICHIRASLASQLHWLVGSVRVGWIVRSDPMPQIPWVPLYRYRKPF